MTFFLELVVNKPFQKLIDFEGLQYTKMTFLSKVLIGKCEIT